MLQSKFEVGDKVKVYKKYDDCEFWTYKMDCCIGQEFIISKIDLDDNSVKFEEKSLAVSYAIIDPQF